MEYSQEIDKIIKKDLPVADALIEMMALSARVEIKEKNND